MNEPRLSRLTAVLARGPGLPHGDTRCGLELDLCLDLRGQIQAACIEEGPWRVRRFWPDREDWRGVLVPVEDGWGVRSAGGDDEPVWEMQGRVLRPGEYITLVRPTDAELVFRIVNIEALP
jgi:hypothetical protein